MVATYKPKEEALDSPLLKGDSVCGSKLQGLESVSLAVLPPFLCDNKEMGVNIK